MVILIIYQRDLTQSQAKRLAFFSRNTYLDRDFTTNLQ